jgi:hypothetical protein
MPARRSSVRVRRCALVVTITLPALLATITSCAASPESITLPASATRSTATADENDIDASVEVAVGLHEMAVVRTLGGNADPAVVRVYELITVTDEPGSLEVRRENASGSQQPAPLTLRARVGTFGDPPREAALLKSVKRRLEQLAGVEVAPIR